MYSTTSVNHTKELSNYLRIISKNLHPEICDIIIKYCGRLFGQLSILIEDGQLLEMY